MNTASDPSNDKKTQSYDFMVEQYCFSQKRNDDFFKEYLRLTPKDQAQGLFEIYKQDALSFANILDDLSYHSIEMDSFCFETLTGLVPRKDEEDFFNTLAKHSSSSVAGNVVLWGAKRGRHFVFSWLNKVQNHHLDDIFTVLLHRGDYVGLLGFLQQVKDQNKTQHLKTGYFPSLFVSNNMKFIEQVLGGELAGMLPKIDEREAVGGATFLLSQCHQLNFLKVFSLIEQRLQKDLHVSFPWGACYKSLANKACGIGDCQSLGFILDKAGEKFSKSPLHKGSLLVWALTALIKRRLHSTHTKDAEEVLNLVLSYHDTKSAVLACFDRPKQMDTLLSWDGWESKREESVRFLGEAYFDKHKAEMVRTRPYLERMLMADELKKEQLKGMLSPKKCM